MTDDYEPDGSWMELLGLIELLVLWYLVVVPVDLFIRAAAWVYDRSPLRFGVP